jgi:hypothetical protein
MSEDKDTTPSPNLEEIKTPFTEANLMSQLKELMDGAKHYYPKMGVINGFRRPKKDYLTPEVKEKKAKKRKAKIKAAKKARKINQAKNRKNKFTR